MIRANRITPILFLCLIALTGATVVAPQQTQTEEFISILGRFGISLPAAFVEYKPFVELRTSSNQKFSTASYRWVVNSDQVVVSYGAGSINLETPESNSTFLTALRDDYISKSVQGSLLGEKKTVLQGHPGNIFVVESTAGRTMVWVYLVTNRFYLLSLTLSDPTKTEQHVNLVSSFRFLSRDDLAPRYEKLVAELTPQALPNELPVKRPTSDAQDARIKGRVKQVITDEEKYEGTELFDDRNRVWSEPRK